MIAAKAAAGIGATVLIEAVSGPKPYPLRTAAQAVAVVHRIRAAGADNVGLPVRPVPPRQQRRRPRRRHRPVRRGGRPRPDRRRAGPGRTGHRQPRPRPLSRRAGGGRLRRLGRAGVQAVHRRHPRQPRLAARANGGGRHDDRRVHRPGHHGQTDGQQPRHGRFRRRRLQPQPPPIDALVTAGGRAAASIAEAVADADVIATMVPDSPDVEEVLTGPGGVYAHARKGSLVIDFSSIRPDVSARMSADGADRGLRVLDAPVSGGEQGAIDATLSIMVGGAAEDFAAARPGPRGGGQDGGPRRPGRLRADRQGGQPAHRGGHARAGGRGDRLPRGLRRRHRSRRQGARRRARRQRDPAAQGARDARPRLHARLPRRPAPQGHGHRDRPRRAKPAW